MMTIRRQVYLLSPEDLITHPIWEFCTDEEDFDGQDEATVRPSNVNCVNGFSPGSYIVAVDFLCNDGASVLGYMYSGKPDDIGCVQPTICTDSGQVNFWFGLLKYRGDSKQQIVDSYRRIGKDGQSIFPLQFRTQVDLAGSRQQGVLQGFSGLDDHRQLVILR